MTDEPVFLLRAGEAARLCGISTITWRRWDSAGRIPIGHKVGGCRLWSRALILEWIASGMPDRDSWQAILQAKAGRGKR